jgi:hypothetical protein
MGLYPGNAILLNGVVQTANREIGVPGIQPLRFVQGFCRDLLAVLAESRSGALCGRWFGNVLLMQ